MSLVPAQVTIGIAVSLRDATGRALFLSYAVFPDLADQADPIDLLESELVTRFSEGCAVGLWDGHAGLRWALTHLVMDGDAAETLGRIDALLSDLLAENPWKGPYGLAEGGRP